MARILVLLDLREGLVEDICLATKYGTFTQIIDYEGVPFHCHRCHSADHLVAQCDKVFSRKWRLGSCKDFIREEVEPIKKSKGNSRVFGYFLSTPTQIHKAAYMIPRLVQIQATIGGETEGDGRIPDG